MAGVVGWGQGGSCIINVVCNDVSLPTCWCVATLADSHEFAAVRKCYNTTCPHFPPSSHPSTHSPPLTSHFLVVVPSAAIVELIFPTRSPHGQITASAQYFNTKSSFSSGSSTRGMAMYNTAQWEGGVLWFRCH